MSTAPPPGPEPEYRDRIDLGSGKRSAGRRGVNRLASQAALVLALIVILALLALLLL
jgi:hypothetical protein